MDMSVPLNSAQNMCCVGKGVSRNKTAYKLVAVQLSSLLPSLMLYADLQFGGWNYSSLYKMMQMCIPKLYNL